MINFLLHGAFYDCCSESHNLTDFNKTSIEIDFENHVTSININSDGYYHIELQNAHFGNLDTGFDVNGDRITIFDPVISILPDDSNQPIIVNLLSNDDCIQSISIFPENFNSTSIIPSGYEIQDWEDYVNNFGHQLLVAMPYF
jgi:hypothetical protein